jgi:hypothetical protein
VVLGEKIASKKISDVAKTDPIERDAGLQLKITEKASDG